MNKTNKNILYNILYQIFIFIIPLVSTPYISRVLGADNIGIYSYTYSIIYYFMLFSMLGISNYGAREIAKSSSNIRVLSKKFISIYLLQLFLNICCICAFFIIVSRLNYAYKNILYLQLPFLLSCGLDINWLFFGLEEFKITISRNLIIKSLSIILIFSLVKGRNDLWLYTVIMGLSTFLSQAYLWLHVKKRIVFQSVSLKLIFSHFKQCLILFIPVVSYCVYRVMDKTMIGYFSSTLELGYYESAEKIISIPVSIITAVGTVMMPNMAKSGDSDFQKKFDDSFKLCFFIVFPLIVGLFCISEDFSYLFFGKEFIKTGRIIIYLLPTVVFSTITNMVRNNYLIPRGKDKIYVCSTLYGAIFNLILNWIFIPKFGSYGACIGTIGAEFAVCLYQILLTKRDILYFSALKKLKGIFASAILFGIINICIRQIVDSLILRMLLQIISSITMYVFLNRKYLLQILGKNTLNFPK